MSDYLFDIIHTNLEISKNFISGRDKQDILVGDFIDHYQNLTLKSMLGIQWFKGLKEKRMSLKVCNKVYGILRN